MTQDSPSPLGISILPPAPLPRPPIARQWQSPEGGNDLVRLPEAAAVHSRPVHPPAQRCQSAFQLTDLGRELDDLHSERSGGSGRDTALSGAHLRVSLLKTPVRIYQIA